MNNDLISEIMGVEVPEFHEACDDETSQDTTSITPDGGGLKEHRYGLTLATFSFVTLNGTDLQQPLPYGRANSVRVDNFGTEWVQIANEVFVPPQWIGYVVQLSRAVTDARIKFTPPQGFTQPAASANGLVFTTWYEAFLNPDPGQPIASGGGSGGGGSSANLNTGQVTVTNVATLILAANPLRHSLAITNDDAAVNIFLGNSTVTATTGWKLGAGNTATFSSFTGAVYGITAASTAVASFAEESS